MKIENKQLISNIFNSIKNIAIVGASLDMERPSHEVMEYCKKFDYKIFPVNPKYSGKNILGVKCFKSLYDLPEPIDIVNVFRKSEHCFEIAKSAVEINAKILWMQIGVINEHATKYAKINGLIVFQDICIRSIHKRFLKKFKGGSNALNSKIL